MNNAFAAKNLHGEALARAKLRDMGAKGTHDAIRKTVLGVDAIAEDRAHALAAFADVAFLSRLAALPDSRMAPRGIAKKETHQVHHVRAEDHQVLSAAACVLFAPAPYLEDFTQFALADHFLDAIHP